MERARAVIRRQHKTLATEQTYLHWLRHYIGALKSFPTTHCLERGTNIKALQEAMGHKQIETTIGYCHAEALSVCSPLEVAR